MFKTKISMNLKDKLLVVLFSGFKSLFGSAMYDTFDYSNNQLKK